MQGGAIIVFMFTTLLSPHAILSPPESANTISSTVSWKLSGSLYADGPSQLIQSVAVPEKFLVEPGWVSMSSLLGLMPCLSLASHRVLFCVCDSLKMCPWISEMIPESHIVPPPSSCCYCHSFIYSSIYSF